MTVYIYGLIDPTTNMIGYVGKSDSPHARWEQHVADKTNTAKSIWVRRMMASGVLPVVVILEAVENEGDWDNAERWWISQGVRMDWPLVNSTHVSIGHKRAQEPVVIDIPVSVPFQPPPLPKLNNIEVKPIEDVPVVLVEGLPLADVIAFIDGLPQRGHSQRPWLGYRFPSGAICDAGYWKRLSYVLRKAGVLQGVGFRKTGHLMVKDPQVIKELLGLDKAG